MPVTPTDPNRLRLKIVALLLGSVLAWSNPAIAAETTLELAPHWKQGQKRSFELVKTRKRTLTGKPAFEATSRTPLTLEVVSAGDDGFVLSWVQGQTKFDDPKLAADPLVRKITSPLDGLRILVEIDKVGDFVGVQNWQELKTKSEQAIVGLIAELKKDNKDPAMFKAIESQVLGMFATQEQVEANCTKEVRMMLLVYGKTFDSAEPLEYDDKLPSPVGGDPVDCHGKFVLKPLNEKSTVANIIWTQSLDADSAARAIRQFIDDAAKKQGRQPPADDALPTLDIQDSAKFSVEIKSGWIRKLTYLRAVTSAEGGQEDGINLEPVEAPKKK